MRNPGGTVSRRDTLKMLGGGGATILAGVGQSVQSATELRKGTKDFEVSLRELTWNARLPQRAPDLIVRARSTSEVAAAVRATREQRSKIAVRGSGHNYHGSFLRDHGVLIDVGAMKAIHINAPARAASVEPGVRGGELIAALAPLGLAFPVGHCPDVGLSGYLLGGGNGWNYGEWGPACMSVQGIEVVTASGEVVLANRHHHPELFWAARGAGRGFFGAVTRYDLKLHPLPGAVQNLSMDYELESLAIVCRWVDEVIHSVHPSVEILCILSAAGVNAPPLLSILAFAMAESSSAASARLGDLRKPPTGAHLVRPSQQQSLGFADLMQGDAGFPSGKRMVGDMRYSNAPLISLMQPLQPFALKGSAPSFAACVLLGGRALPPNRTNTACSMTGQVDFGVYAFYDNPAEDAKQSDWVRSATRAVEHLCAGGYISESDLAAGPDVARQCFSPGAWTRLGALKKHYDPEDRFFGFEAM
jgi:FAD binding domain